MKIFSWNVERRVQTTLGRQLEAALGREPDIIALQEINLGTYDDWSQGLKDAGYLVVDSKDLVVLPYPPPPYTSPPFPKHRTPTTQVEREPFNLLAARHPIQALPGLAFEDRDEARYAFPEKYIAARVEVNGAQVDFHNAHLPHGSGRGHIKVHAFEAIRRRVDQETGNPRVLCGDFNAPEFEDAEGPLPSGTTARTDALSAGHTRWIEAEAGVVENPAMRDVYRDAHDSGKPFPVSHFTGRKGPFTPHRYDYIFASRELKTESCEYLSDWLTGTREGGGSATTRQWKRSSPWLGERVTGHARREGARASGLQNRERGRVLAASRDRRPSAWRPL